MPAATPAVDVYIQVSADEHDDAHFDGRDPVLAILQEAAESVYTGNMLISNQGYLYDAVAESFIQYAHDELEGVMLLYLFAADVFPGERRELRVYAAVRRGYEILLSDSNGRSIMMLPDHFGSLLARYDNNHGEPREINTESHFASELHQLAVAYTFSPAGYDVLWIFADDKYIAAGMRRLDDDMMNIIIFESYAEQWLITAFFEERDDLRASVNAVLPDFNFHLVK
jgi:hypothetical protein